MGSVNAASFDALQKDRLIELHIGADPTTPYLIQQQLLVATSDYFSKSLKPEAFQEGRNGCLRFPEDDVDAWMYLFPWMLHKDVPDNMETKKVTKAWTLADKYNIPDLQDALMLWLLDAAYEDNFTKQNVLHMLKYSPGGSLLCKLAANLAVPLIYKYGQLKLDKLQGLSALALLDIMRAHERYEDNESNLACIMDFDCDAEDENTWQDYMVTDDEAMHRRWFSAFGIDQ